mmetsp:Transcript_13693/g.28086  ORF Transcript_13693/g.28086 Transcript_13693/m.28086 type:complete len:257 (-) Transcript_13693:251-1021(-)
MYPHFRGQLHLPHDVLSRLGRRQQRLHCRWKGRRVHAPQPRGILPLRQARRLLLSSLLVELQRVRRHRQRRPRTRRRGPLLPRLGGREQVLQERRRPARVYVQQPHCLDVRNPRSLLHGPLLLEHERLRWRCWRDYRHRIQQVVPQLGGLRLRPRLCRRFPLRRSRRELGSSLRYRQHLLRHQVELGHRVRDQVRRNFHRRHRCRRHYQRKVVRRLRHRHLQARLCWIRSLRWCRRELGGVVRHRLCLLPGQVVVG